MLAINNALVFVDLVLVPHINFAVPRSGSFFLATALLLYGLVRDTD